ILMHELLTTQKRAVLTQALTGLGGIGKTQTAIEYIYRHHQEYTAILWARGHSQEALIADFTNVARTLHLPINQDSDQQHIILAVKQWFNTHTNWLLFLDDVDDVETLADFLPQGGIGHVILTTRARSVGTIANAVVIEKWPVADGALFLLRRAKKMKADESIHIASDKDQSVAREITQLLDGLPLALDQAGAYIEETGCSLDHYLHLYQQRRMELLHRRGKQTSHHPESVAATFSLCFEKVAQINPIAVEILHCCSWLDPDHIPEEIITEGATELGSVLFPLSSNPFLFDEAVADLGRYSLIQRHAETRTLSTHRLVQAVLTDMVGKPQQKIWAERVVQAVCSLFPGKEGANWQHLQRYLAQIQACAALIEQWEVRSGAIVAWLFRVGHLCETCGFHAVAERLYLLGNAVRKANLSDGIAGVFGQDFADELVLSPAMDTLSSASPLSRLYYQQGKYTQAEQLNRRFVELLEQQFGSQHPVLIGHLNNLAATYSTTGRYKEAEVLLQRALDIHFQTGEVDLDELATLLNGLAELYRKQEKYDQAEPLYQQVLEIAERANDPLKLADRSHNLALVYRAQRKYDEAEQLYQRAQTIYETVYGPENAYLARTLNSLGVVYLCQKRYSEAEVLLLKALAMREKVLGLEHPDVARTLNNLGNLYVNLENYQQAQRVLQRSVETYTKSLGPEHVETAMSLANLGQTYYGQNKYVEAEASLEKALDIHEQTIGLQAPDVMQIFQALVLVYIAQKKALRIQQVCQRILPALKARLGEHHKDVRAIQDMLMHFSPENIRTGFIQTSFSKRSHHQRNKKRRKKR
ncbi:MAG TPA: tetratricopeptide repeat protein, partial [Ktedonobacteraceae bacterium]|nr:tetratricopeptide repeat protein [Ktedonobacteraceae bacterium]